MSVCRVVLVCMCLCACIRACSGAYSSFWAPLYDRRLLNYRVDAAFDPDIARQGREQYAARYGYRGERLIADIGNGKDLLMDPETHRCMEMLHFNTHEKLCGCSNVHWFS